MMLRQRLTTAALLVPVFLWVIHRGGWLYGVVVLVLLTIGAWEFTRIATVAGTRPSASVSIAGVWAIAGGVALADGRWMVPVVAALLLCATAWHVIAFERGARTPLQDWAATLAAPLYLGGFGGHLLALRLLPHGAWWTLTVLPAMWLSDTGAYAMGSWMGKRPMARRTSPNKTWEGFFGGAVWGAVFGGLLTELWQRVGALTPAVLGWREGVVIGLLVSLAGPVGDLAISMLKRQTGIKDTGRLLAGHGGVLDRIDSWLLAGAASYYYIFWVAL
ncbi:MAG TPA: phosphatidate cytidylyltransferase [Anaerolineales bacterium]|jgi:phosphatidate cytidylyltransferase|nr:phosphatidate cytidylyltransferase [Anaerolineales bacterium]